MTPAKPTGAVRLSTLRLVGYTKTYGRTPAVADIDLLVEPASVHGLLGANGSGKSSIVHGIAGVVGFDAGTVEIDGFASESREAKLRLGFVPDELPLPESLSGNEYLDFCARLQPGADPDWRLFLTDLLGITQVLGRFIGDYSHGMKKKLQLVAALGHHPVLLVLDEPFRGLDAEASLTVLALLSAHRERGGACLIATHDLAFAERECDVVSIVADGGVRAVGTPSELRARHDASSLADVFFEVSGLDSRRIEAAELIDHAWPAVGLDCRASRFSSAPK